MTHFVNSFVFQAWFLSTSLGAVATVATGDGAYVTFMPWVGLFVGIAMNELSPGYGILEGFIVLERLEKQP